jgi:hypothetical protein
MRQPDVPALVVARHEVVAVDFAHPHLLGHCPANALSINIPKPMLPGSVRLREQFGVPRSLPLLRATTDRV